MNENKVMDVEAKRAADAVYHFAKANYYAGVKSALLGVGVVAAGVAAGGLVVIIIKEIKNRSGKKTN